ncbi:GNAT family N-acetyltransferase [Sphingosinicella rhizophila]|uniref:GNAT family N-acetyltransferase n=1 Tax=Sphingosinicella rhizophila TaxID=3050082 RepID=A0ABU3QB30_9SPHN|nr:GNAT family N-acetyltransferase [Sphingosinicella sp. GR2756]MDT9600586.1 GNAT family N-acetyltransferase [Sphingosinicella sp. GR2756]
MRMDPFTIRWAGPADHEALGEVVFDAVRNGRSFYDEAQRKAWAAAPPKGEAWDARLGAQEIVAVEAPGRIVGFMSLAGHGYVDFAYIRPEAQGSGLFARMLAMIEGRARAKGETRLWVHASLMAEPAFAAHGFALVLRERVTIGDQLLDRCEMEKYLDPPGVG